jgi:hypothetical protein
VADTAALANSSAQQSARIEEKVLAEEPAMLRWRIRQST